jgi:hypothetical protein
MNIINTAPFFKNLAAGDQGYLKAALQEEMSRPGSPRDKRLSGRPASNGERVSRCSLRALA